MTTNIMLAIGTVGFTPMVITGLVLFLLGAVLFGPFVIGAVLIQERQVGIVVKRFGGRSLPPGQLIALAGEAGYQADTLAPGLHFGFWRWQYRIINVPVTVVPQGEIDRLAENGDVAGTRIVRPLAQSLRNGVERLPQFRLHVCRQLNPFGGQRARDWLEGRACRFIGLKPRAAHRCRG